MEEKKVAKIRLSTAILVFIIIVLIVALVITYYFGFVKKDENTETKQENLSNASNSISNDSEIAEENDNKQESNNTNTESQIILEGGFAFEAGDAYYEFDKQGNVSISGNVNEEKGTYKTIGTDEIEIHLTTEKTFNIETGESTTTSINKTEKIKVIDENTLLVDNYKLIRLEDNNNTSYTIDGTYECKEELENIAYVFKDGQVTLETLATTTGTYEIVGDKIKIHFNKTIDHTENTPKDISEDKELKILDSNTLINEEYNTKYYKTK